MEEISYGEGTNVQLLAEIGTTDTFIKIGLRILTRANMMLTSVRRGSSS